MSSRRRSAAHFTFFFYVFSRKFFFTSRAQRLGPPQELRWGAQTGPNSTPSPQGAPEITKSPRIPSNSVGSPLLRRRNTKGCGEETAAFGLRGFSRRAPCARKTGSVSVMSLQKNYEPSTPGLGRGFWLGRGGAPGARLRRPGRMKKPQPLNYAAFPAARVVRENTGPFRL